jgi:hypothetical protein
MLRQASGFTGLNVNVDTTAAAVLQHLTTVSPEHLSCLERKN